MLREIFGGSPADPDPPGGPSPTVETRDPEFGEPASPTIYEVLARRARRASDARLAIDASVGVVAIISLPFVRPLLWGLVLPFVIVGAYGLWGIADRELAEDSTAPVSADAPLSSKRDVLVLVKRLAVVLGTVAAVVGAAMFMVMALGDFIS